MFTGIIEAVGTIQKIDSIKSDKQFTITANELDLSDVSVGNSVCINGVCLTVIKVNIDGFITDVSTETLSCTNFSQLGVGDHVNLEKSLQLGERLGGHIVSGHVDAVGEIEDIKEEARSIRYQINFPATLQKYISKKGSICIDGVSLTVNDVADGNFGVNIIPHTLEVTIFRDYKPGTKVNLEVDMIARYIESLLQENRTS